MQGRDGADHGCKENVKTHHLSVQRVGAWLSEVARRRPVAGTGLAGYSARRTELFSGERKRGREPQLREVEEVLLLYVPTGIDSYR